MYATEDDSDKFTKSTFLGISNFITHLNELSYPKIIQGVSVFIFGEAPTEMYLPVLKNPSNTKVLLLSKLPLSPMLPLSKMTFIIE